MKALDVMVKSTREQFRDWIGLGITLALPAMILSIFAMIFGGGLPAMKVFVDNQDKGPTGKAVIEALRQFKYKDGKPSVIVTEAPVEEAAVKIRSFQGHAYLKIPANFSERVTSGENVGASDLLVGVDPGQISFTTMSYMSIADGVAMAIEQVTGKPPASHIKQHWIGEQGTVTEFDSMAPGFLVFAVMLLVIQVAMIVVNEVEKGTIQRLRLTAMTAGDFFAGITGSQMIICAIQVPLIFGVLKLFGYNNAGSLFFGYIMCVALSISAVGFGLVTSCFTRSPGMAASLASMVALPIIFLSGAMFPIPPFPLAKIGGRTIDLFDIVPAKHTMDGLTATLTYGRDWSGSVYQLGATIVLSLVYLVLGAMIFQRVRMKTEY